MTAAHPRIASTHCSTLSIRTYCLHPCDHFAPLSRTQLFFVRSQITYPLAAAYCPLTLRQFQDRLTHCSSLGITPPPPDDLLFIVPSYHDRFPARFRADLLIGTSGYSVLAAIPWTTQCSPRFPKQPGLLPDTPGHLLLALLRLIVRSSRRLIDRQLWPLIAGQRSSDDSVFALVLLAKAIQLSTYCPASQVGSV